eukprot:m.92987 g.92987  ORF g.92987 m.92987 type:complete len:125 (-) comp26590_c1_seq1:351-725(-)
MYNVTCCNATNTTTPNSIDRSVCFVDDRMIPDSGFTKSKSLKFNVLKSDAKQQSYSAATTSATMATPGCGGNASSEKWLAERPSTRNYNLIYLVKNQQWFVLNINRLLSHSGLSLVISIGKADG